MLKPAIEYKNELMLIFDKIIDTPEYCNFNGTDPVKIPSDSDCEYQFAIIEQDQVVGFMSYRISTTWNEVINIRVIAFQKNNLTFVFDVFHEFKRLVKSHVSVSWICGGNSRLVNFYDNLCSRYNGNRLQIIYVSDKSSDIGYCYVIPEIA